MQLAFKSPAQEKVFRAVTRELEFLGYQDDLLQQAYGFRDWFSPSDTSRVAPAVAFGRTPVSYDSACAAVLLANGLQGPELVRDFRALGAPRVFEVHDDRVVEWRVTLEPSLEDMCSVIPAESISRVFSGNKTTWNPEAVLRAKNIGPSVPVQWDFCDLGLIPALEEQIRAKLDPLLRNVLADAQQDYHGQTSAVLDPAALFRLAIWSLSGKVFHDRGVAPFSDFSRTSEPDDVLKAVAAYYGEPLSGLLLKQTRRIVHDQIWTKLDFSNISVDVLAHVWLNTFVTQDVRDKLSIHQTPRSVARFVLERLPVEAAVQTNRPIIEPCSGSATFLIAALHRLRDVLPGHLGPRQRHAVLKRLLIGYETDPFAVEISRLSLTLADFPNPNGWQLKQEDVFDSRDFLQASARASLVVCNPPYGDFTEDERKKYGVEQAHKPAELLRRLLVHLPLDASLGFVLPRRFLDGKAYREARVEIVRRWTSIEIVNLPEAAFPTADQETLLLIATAPKSSSSETTTSVSHRRITLRGWGSFEARSGYGTVDKGLTDSERAESSLGIRELSAVWENLSHCRRLEEHAQFHRGIEWNKPMRANGQETGNRSRLVLDSPVDGYQEGYPPQCKIDQFQCPPTKFLSTRERDMRRTGQGRSRDALRWDLPKIFVHAHRKSRGRWPLAAVADGRPLICYQSITAVWPNQAKHLHIIEAVLNGPVANAFVANIEAKRDVRVTTLRAIPIPRLEAIDCVQLEARITEYRKGAGSSVSDASKAAMLLREIDAIVLNGYGLPAEVELELLHWFDGHRRSAHGAFEEYFPLHADAGISLKEFVEVETRWTEINARRLDLIDREIDGINTSDETMELGRLQVLADVKFRPQHMETVRRLEAEIGSVTQ